MPFEVDHIIAKKHHGQTVAENLALSCFYCNSYKGPNIAGIDLQTRNTVVLFHPWKDNWNHHFQWEGPRLGKNRGQRLRLDQFSRLVEMVVDGGGRVDSETVVDRGE
ncbi:MAG: HNH endonuclease [Pirellulaceae bacterium]|nr:HNH endonuclease [Pirellulaceae bacterium]